VVSAPMGIVFVPILADVTRDGQERVVTSACPGLDASMEIVTCHTRVSVKNHGKDCCVMNLFAIILAFMDSVLR